MKEIYNSERYTELLEKIAQRVDYCTIEEKAEMISEKLFELSIQRNRDAAWYEYVNTYIGKVVEFFNFCAIKGDSHTIPTAILEVLLRLDELRYSMGSSEHDLSMYENIENVGEILLAAGSCVQIQEERYWKTIPKLFGFDENPGKQLKEIVPPPYVNPDETHEEKIRRLALTALKDAVINNNKRISMSRIQRLLGVGYGYAAQIVDWLEIKGAITSHKEGEQSFERKVIISPKDAENL